ncbi:MAG: hypothetical protein WCE58_10900 [Gallionella sp.]
MVWPGPRIQQLDDNRPLGAKIAERRSINFDAPEQPVAAIRRGTQYPQLIATSYGGSDRRTGEAMSGNLLPGKKP